MNQSPTISIPRKKGQHFDWSQSLRTSISEIYKENPESFASECAAFQGYRDNAVEGAGSDLVACEHLNKYFGQMERLELHFPEIRGRFVWHDAFEPNTTTQTSLAYEKACIIFQLASVHSSLGSSQDWSRADGSEKAIKHYRTAAGMLEYLGVNFVHAPSADLAKDNIDVLCRLMIAQATEATLWKFVAERKGPSTVSKVAAKATQLNSQLHELIDNRTIFDRVWVALVQIKFHFFNAYAFYFKSLADKQASDYGVALSRLMTAEAQAAEAVRLASIFKNGLEAPRLPAYLTSKWASTFKTTLSKDAGRNILDSTSACYELVRSKLAKDKWANDRMYHTPVPPLISLPALEKVKVAVPISIQDAYATDEVQNILGPDVFASLIPMNVHEEASVYSEEKAKVLRAAKRRISHADEEGLVIMDRLGLPQGLHKWLDVRAQVKNEEIPQDLMLWTDEVKSEGGIEAAEKLFAELKKAQRQAERDHAEVQNALDDEQQQCESMRVKYGPLWDQESTTGLSQTLRNDSELDGADLKKKARDFRKITQIWEEILPDLVQLLSEPDALRAFLAGEVAGLGRNASQRTFHDSMKKAIEIDDRICRLNRIYEERAQVLVDLKTAIERDDITHLLLGKRSEQERKKLFALEIAKYRAYEVRIAKTSEVQVSVLDEIERFYKALVTNPNQNEWQKDLEDFEQERINTMERLRCARDGWRRTTILLAKGIRLYHDLGQQVARSKRTTSSFLIDRADERRRCVVKAEAALRNSTGEFVSPVSPTVPNRTTGIESHLSSMALEDEVDPFLDPPSHPPDHLSRPSTPFLMDGDHTVLASPNSPSPSLAALPPPPYELLPASISLSDH